MSPLLSLVKDLGFNPSRPTYKMRLNQDYSQLMGIWNMQK